MNDVNRLWVHVSCFGEGNLFAVYPRILAAMLAGARESSKGPPDFEILLPSDAEWKTKIYFQLVEKQRGLVGMPQPAAFLDRPRSPSPWDTTVPQPPNKRSRRCTLNSSTNNSRLSVSSSVSPVTWTVSDIAKAACLLSTPAISTEFGDEQEMRRVYSLIYDVFRYKNILHRALADVSFFYLFPELKPSKHLVWLLLYDLYHRRFVEREFADAESSELLFPSCGLQLSETALWATRVRLAAAMSRLRIANNALRLSDMLPPHLRDERVAKAAHLAPVTCWVNKNRTKIKTPEDIFEEIKHSLELQCLSDDSSSLGPDEFRWDPLCSMFLSFHHSQRTHLAQSEYVRKNILIMQNRSFCFGPSAFSKLLFEHNLTGTVIQTHISSPRATAYLATLLAENDQIFTLLAFGAGDRKAEYEEYFESLKIKNIMVFSKRLVDIAPDTDILEQVVAVFATPPNSYSAVNDPIDLVCSRGGDLSMLEILTDTEDSVEGQKRVISILEEQRLTLRFSMSRPQIQFVLYETHSQLSAENEDMVTQVLQEVNRAAQYKHAELQGKITLPHSAKTEAAASSLETQEINNNETDLKKEQEKDEITVANKLESDESETSVDSSESDEDMFKDIELPATDRFEEHKLPDLCINSDDCLSLTSEGCYLALLQRKVVTRFDAKYMIKMAEARGLFGYSSSDAPHKSKTQKTVKQRKKETNNIAPIKRKRGTFKVERIAAHTHASIMRSCSHALRNENGEEMTQPLHFKIVSRIHRRRR
ncbi:uncharacterized protein CBL_12635 [Carabus blaptoides fortunei]